MNPLGTEKIIEVESSKLIEAKDFIEYLVNRTIERFRGGLLDDSFEFEDFKIKGSDFPSEKLPNNSEDVIRLERYLKDANGVLYKAWNEYVEKKKTLKEVAGSDSEKAKSLGEDIEKNDSRKKEVDGNVDSIDSEQREKGKSTETEDIDTEKRGKKEKKKVNQEEVKKTEDLIIEEKKKTPSESVILEKGKAACEELARFWKKLPDYERLEPVFEPVFQRLDIEGKNYFNSLCQKDKNSPDWKKLGEEEKNRKIEARVEHIEAVRDLVKKRLSELGIKVEEKKIREGLDNNDGMVEAKGMSLEFIARVEELKKELEKVRKEYLETDYKKKTALKRIYSFLGSTFKNREEKTLENDLDVAWYRAHYDNKLFDLQRLLIEDAKERGVSDKELVEIGIYFKIEQQINMAEAHDQVKVEQQDQKFVAFVGKKIVELAETYRKLSLGKKLLLTGAFMGGGLVAAGAGGAALSAFATTATARKMLLGMFTGVGVTLGLEAKEKKNKKVLLESEKVKFLESIQGMSNEDKYAFISDNIKNISIRDEESAINKIKNQDIRQKIAGVSAGFAAAVLPGVIKHYGGDAYGWVVEKFSTEDVAIPSMPETVLEVKKGDSFEGTLIKHLSDPGADIYKYHPELKSIDPGNIAHRLALDFAHDHGSGLPDSVHPDAKIKINFDPAALKINGTLEDSVRIEIEDKVGSESIPDNAKPVSAEEIKIVPEAEAQNPPVFIVEKDNIGNSDSRLEKVLQSQQETETKFFTEENRVVSESSENIDPNANKQVVLTEKETVQEGKSSLIGVEKVLAESKSYDVESGKISFNYDANGKIISMQSEVAPSGLKGNEQLTGDFRRILLEKSRPGMANTSINIATMESRNVSAYAKIFNELRKGGHDKEAKVVLEKIYSIVVGTEKNLGVKIFDRSKLPSM